MLGRAVRANDGDAERSGPLAEGHGHRRTAETDPFDLRGVLRSEVGVVQEARQEHRRTGSPADALLQHHLERMRRIPPVDQMDVLARDQWAEHGAEHPGRVGDRRAHQVGLSRVHVGGHVL